MSLWPAPALAQQETSTLINPPTESSAVAPGGVNLRNGGYVYNETDLAIGGGGGLTLTRTMSEYVPGHGNPFGNLSHNWDITLSEAVNQQQDDLTYRIRINFGGRSQTFKSPYPSTGFGPETVGPLMTLTYTGSRTSASIVYTYTAADGSVAVFRPLGLLGNGDCSFERRCAFISTLTEADGTVYNLDYAPGGGSGGTVWLKSVTSSRGYALLFEGTANRITKACVINLSLGTLPSTCPSGALATANYSYTTSGTVRLTGATGPDNETSSFTYGTNGTMAFVRPGEASAWQTLTLAVAADEQDMVRTITGEQSFADGLTYSYIYESSPATNNRPFPTIAGGSYGYNDGQNRSVPMPYDYPLMHGSGSSTCYSPPCPLEPPDAFLNWVYQQTPGPVSVTDELNRTTIFNYCDPVPLANLPANEQNRCVVVPLVSFTDPEGAVTELRYDGRGNIDRVTRHPRPDSLQTNGDPWPDIVTSAVYDINNVRSQTRPLSMTDARGNTTTYTYDTAHGGLLTVTGPAVNGVSPQTRHGYAQRHAWIASGGGYAQAAAPIWLRTSTSTCRTSAASTTGTHAPCSVAGDEVSISQDYGPDSGPNTLLLRGQTVTSTDGGTTTTLRSCYAYDALGRKISETSPNANLTSCPGTPPTTALPYTSSTRYDAGNRVTGTITADPDGIGWLPFLAARNSYDSAGRLIKAEAGTLSSWQSEAVAPSAWTGFTVSRSVETRYDAMGRKVREWTREGSAGTVQTLTEYKYDLRGRLLCTTVRMNPSLFAYTGTPDACAQSVSAPLQSGQQWDRISRNVYDAAGQRVQLRTGVGSDVEAAEATWAYNDTGQITTVIDGNGNGAALVYDGHGRQSCWMFPSTTRPGSYNDATQALALGSDGDLSGAIDQYGRCTSGDYEAYGYDPNGNRTSLRKRDTSALSYTYDALNRISLKTVPERPGGSQALTAAQTRDVYYAYDLRGLQLFARFDSVTGDGVSSSYDGFGRMLTSRIVMGASDRTLSYQYDRNGSRIRLTHPDTTYFTYDADQSARLNFIRENGATSGIGVLATIGYAPEGMPGAVVPPNGMITAFGYDGIGRQNMLLHDLTGSAGDVTWTYTRNPASGIATQARNNDAYAWGSHYAVTRAYTTNGLSQYTAAGAANFNYDGNANLITTPGPGPSEVLTFVYDIENRLVGRSSSTGYSPIVTLFYDPLGRLFSSTVNGTTTEFLYDGDALVGEYVGTNLTERYVHAVGADVPVLWYHGNALTDRRWLHADHQGSIVATSTGSGALGTLYTYDEYGIPGASSTDRFRYTGQIWLPELGLYHYKARVYSPYLGRFLQTDPVGYDDQYNLYAYVRNDPVNRTDPTGMYEDPRTTREGIEGIAADAREHPLTRTEVLVGAAIALGGIGAAIVAPELAGAALINAPRLTQATAVGAEMIAPGAGAATVLGAAGQASRTTSLATPTANRAASSLRAPTVGARGGGARGAVTTTRGVPPRVVRVGGRQPPPVTGAQTIDRTPQLAAETTLVQGIYGGGALQQRTMLEIIADGFASALGIN